MRQERFADRDGVVHVSAGSYGAKSLMWCEDVRGRDAMRWAPHELRETVKCATCLWCVLERRPDG